MGIFYYLKRLEHKLENYRFQAAHAKAQESLAAILSSVSSEEKVQVLFVCTGNICRSAYAHHALVKLLEEKKIENLSVISAGISTTPGKRADKTAKKIALEREVDLDKHITSLVYRQVITDSTLIIVMEPVHRRCVLSIDPSAENKIVLGGLLGADTDNPIVDDPYGRSSDTFRSCFDILDRVNNTLIKHLIMESEDDQTSEAKLLD